MCSEQRIRVLYMEDDPAAARLLQKRLVRFGYKVDIACDGEQGLNMWDRGSYDLVAIDHDMPNVSGLDVIRALASKGPLPPTIMVTRPGNEKIAAEAMKLGADDYIMKDAQARYLELVPAVIEAALARKRLLRERELLQQALSASERLYRDTFDKAAVGLCHRSFDGRLIRVNRALCDFLGYAQEELCRLTFADVTHPDYLGEDSKSAKRLRSGEIDHYSTDHLFVRKNGSFVWGRLTVSLAGDVSESSGYFIGVVEDITRRRNVETALRTERDRARMYLDIARAIIVALDTNGTVTLINQMGCQVLGYDRNEIIGRNWFDTFVPQRDRDSAYQVFSEIMRGARDPIEYFESSVLVKGGEERLIAWRSDFVTDDAGRTVGSLSSGEDITDRKKAKKELLESRQRFADLVNTTVGIVWEADARTFDFTFVSKKAEDILGYPISDWYKPGFWADHLHPADREWAIDFCLERTKLLESHEIQYRFLKKNGEVAWIRDIVSVVAEDGVARFLRGLMSDVTEQKRSEERQEQLIEEMKDFTYFVSHDLRSPLANIRGFFRELQSELDLIIAAAQRTLPKLEPLERDRVVDAIEGSIPEALTFIESSICQMDHLTKAILKLSRVGRMELDFDLLDMNELVKETLNASAHELQEKGVSVFVANLPATRADRTAMEQIMGNLIGNALKYTDPDRPCEIHITGHKYSTETVFSVTDSGRGIPRRDLNRIFQAFQRSGSPSVAGEGMGLAYVRILVRRHGGRIWCESQPGVGSTFTFTISNHLGTGHETP
ncbi:MAG: PAS domain S-box protein [Thermodesulfobacteriota bacterium]